MIKPPYDILPSNPTNNKAAIIFANLANMIVEDDWSGACHITTAMLFVAFNEIGIRSEPIIGEALVGNKYFDHSWLEVDGKVFDAAIIKPLEIISKDVIGPVFGSIDILAKMPTIVEYGVHSGVEPFDDAQHIMSIGIIEFLSGFPGNPSAFDRIKSITGTFSQSTKPRLISKYSNLMWSSRY